MSKELLDNALQEVAPGLYRGMIVAYSDKVKSPHMGENMGLGQEKRPFIAVFDEVTGDPIVYNDRDNMSADAIRAWANKIMKGEIRGKSLDEQGNK